MNVLTLLNHAKNGDWASINNQVASHTLLEKAQSVLDQFFEQSTEIFKNELNSIGNDSSKFSSLKGVIHSGFPTQYFLVVIDLMACF